MAETDEQSPEATSVHEEFFFYEQTTYRKTPRRYRKTPDELPEELRYAHLNPKLAAYLASKDKEQRSSDGLFDDGLGNKSLLPQISQTVALIRQRLDSTLGNNDDAQRVLYDEAKFKAHDVLIHLARILYLFDGYKVNIPRSLEGLLLCGYKEFAADAIMFPRDWQCPANRDASIESRLLDQGAASVISREDGRESTLSFDRATPADGAQSSRSVGQESDDSSKSKDEPKRKVKVTRIAGPLTDIVEDDEETGSKYQDSDVASRNKEAPGIPASGKRDAGERGSSKPKTRLDRFRSMQTDPRMSLDRRTSSVGFRRPSGMKEETGSVIAASSILSEGSKTGLDKSGYFMSVIQFQLSSKHCEDKGWIVHNPGDDLEQETILEWATQRLQLSLRQKKEQMAIDKANGLDKPVILRYYGDSHSAGGGKYGKRMMPRLSSTQVGKGQKPSIPAVDIRGSDGKKLFMTSVSDGTTTVFYPSGRTAVLSTSAGLQKRGFYTIVYEDRPEQQMLACFTPSGQGCCYYQNGVIRFLATETGGSVAESDGAVSKRWDWPANGAKLPASIILQLSTSLTFRCVSRTQMQVHFSCQRENAKFNVGLVEGEEVPSRDELGYMISGVEFSSRTAKEFARPAKSRHKLKGKLNVKQKPDKKNASPDVQKLLEIPEPTENDADADKELYRLQRKTRTLVEDWLEHYRIAVGIKSPHIRNMKESPKRSRQGASSAKSHSGETRVLIEREATSIATPSAQRRVQSAAAPSQPERPQSTPTDEASQRLSPTVKFDDRKEEMEIPEVECVSPFPGSVSTGKSGGRSRSAPLPMTSMSVERTWSPPRGACPVALRQAILGDERPTCKCSRHKVPQITDVEYDEFIFSLMPPGQLAIVSVVSSLFPEVGNTQDMVTNIHSERNKNRTRPCLQARQDPYRLFVYDLVTASEDSGYMQPLLLRRHNVLPGMYLMYEDGKLLFCDHIFNGYGNARKDFQKQVMATMRLANTGHCLPKDFKFSPQHGRKGMRSAWGGEIGGAGIGRHGSPGLTLETGIVKRTSNSSLSSGDSEEHLHGYHIRTKRQKKGYLNLVWSWYSNKVH